MGEAINQNHVIASLPSRFDSFHVLAGVKVHQVAHIKIKQVGVFAGAAVLGVNHSNGLAQVSGYL